MEEGKIALVTGGSRGVGRAICLELARRGAHVALTYVKKKGAAESVAETISAMGRRALVICANMGDPADIQRMFAEVRAAFGGLDIFVNNAVSAVLRPAMELTPKHWAYTQEVNVRSFLLSAQEASKLMEGRGGRIVSLSSVGSIRALPGYMALGAAKAAVEAMTRYLAVELAPRGIGVNAVCGGPVDTDALRVFPDAEGLKARWTQLTPAGRMGRPEDLAKVVAFLCSDDAEWVRGQVIVADGGLSLTCA